MTKKQRVQYIGEVIIPAEKEQWKYGAIICDVLDHPRLGRCPVVHTSAIVKYNKKTGRIETLNTIYIKKPLK